MANHNRAAWNRLYKARKMSEVTTWCICPPTELTTEEREIRAREDAEIQRRREAFPLH